MRTIWKFPIEITDEQIVKMPLGAKILTVQTQHGNPYLWAEVEGQNRDEDRKIYVFGTGHEMPPLRAVTYIGTIQAMGGSLIWHVYSAA